VSPARRLESPADGGSPAYIKRGQGDAMVISRRSISQGLVTCGVVTVVAIARHRWSVVLFFALALASTAVDVAVRRRFSDTSWTVVLVLTALLAATAWYLP
jgi:hypothetical protein